MLAGNAVNFASALGEVTEYFTPRVVGQVNDQYVKVAKLKGEFVWHDHPDEDEMFIVIYGRLQIHFEDWEVILGPGDFCIVPKKIRHKPVAEEECGIVLIETVTTRHTGDIETPMTVAIDAQFT